VLHHDNHYTLSGVDVRAILTAARCDYSDTAPLAGRLTFGASAGFWVGRFRRRRSASSARPPARSAIPGVRRVPV